MYANRGFLCFSTLSPEQRQFKDALVMFVMKDQDFYGAKNDYMAEAFVSLSDASDASTSAYPKQIHLKLNRPKNTGTGDFAFWNASFRFSKPIFTCFGFLFTECDILKALDYRKGDSLAKDFVKKQKVRMEVPH